MKFKAKKLPICLLAAALLLLPLAGACVWARPTLVPSVTLAPTQPPTPSPTPSPSPSPEPEETPVLTPTPAPESSQLIGVYDAFGAFVSTPEHYKQYIEFQNIQVYEQFGDTFVDAVAVNTYPKPLVCAVNIVFAQDGETVAEGKLQTQDGQYVLILQPGENTVYAQVNTDMTLTLTEFTLEYDSGLGVWPQ